MASYQALFFDAGFTLLEMYPSWEALFMQVTSAYGLHFSHPDAHRANRASQSYFESIYYRPNDIWADDAQIKAFWTTYYRIGLQAVGCPPERLEPCAQALADLLNRDVAWRAYAEVPQVLADLRQAGYTIGILSDWGSSLPEILERTGLRPLADFLVVSAIEGLAKPRPAFFRRALDRAGVLPHQALMVGDNLYADVQGAAGAGIPGVLIDRPGRNHAADVPTIRRLDELWSYLANGTAPGRKADAAP